MPNLTYTQYKLVRRLLKLTLIFLGLIYQILEILKLFKDLIALELDFAAHQSYSEATKV